MDDLAQRIAVRLHEALDERARAGMLRLADRGLGLFDEGGADGSCYLTVEDLARIAAQEARAWF